MSLSSCFLFLEIKKSNWTDIYNKKYLVFEFKDGRIEKKYDLNYKNFFKLKKKLFVKFVDRSNSEVLCTTILLITLFLLLGNSHILLCTKHVLIHQKYF